MNITTIGIDLANSVFQVHGVDKRGKTVVQKQLRRSKVLEFFVQLPPCLIGMGACSSAHYWARKLSEQGHEVKLMAPQFVKPYVKANKTDAIVAGAWLKKLELISQSIGARINNFESKLHGFIRFQGGYIYIILQILKRFKDTIGN